MKPTAILFILFQSLDVITTFIGMHLGLLELNPLSTKWHNMIGAKGAVTIGVAAILQIKKTSWLDWILVGISVVAVLWNVGMIVYG